MENLSGEFDGLKEDCAAKFGELVSSQQLPKASPEEVV